MLRTGLGFIAAVALLASASTASASTTYDMRGTWFITGPYSQSNTITAMNMATGEFSGTGAATNGTGYTWPDKGTVSGSTVKWTFGPYVQAPYTATCEGTLSPEGNAINGTCSDTNGLKGQAWSMTLTRGAAIQVSCSTLNVGLPNEYMQCTAQVGDASGKAPARIPTGTVAFSLKPGGGGAFQGASTCTLAPSQSGGASSFCSVNYLPPAGGIPVGSQPPIIGTYSGDTNFGPSSAAATGPVAGPPLKEVVPVLCIQLPGQTCSGIDVTLPKETVINNLDTTEVSVGCDEEPAAAASAHIAATFPLPSPNFNMEAPSKPAKCKVQVEIDAAKKAKEKVEKEIKLLEKKKELNEREAPIREKNQRVEEELKRLRKVSQAFGNELPAAPQAQSASAHRQKVPKFALSLGWARVELSARTRRKVKLTVPKANRGLLTLLRHTQIRTLPLTVRITVIRSGETKTTSKSRTVTYKLRKR